MESTHLLSPNEISLARRLELLVCQPNELQGYICDLGNRPYMSFGSGQSDEEFGELLEQLLKDNRRLELLTGDELLQLSQDPASLRLLAEEVSDCPNDAWDAPMGEAGEARLVASPWSPPAWTAMQAHFAEADNDSPKASTRSDAPFGEVLESEAPSGARALAFERSWSDKRLQWLQETPSPLPFGVAIGNARFRLQAYVARENNKGQWLMRLSGGFPHDDQATVEVAILERSTTGDFDRAGWGTSVPDVTSPVRLGPGRTVDIDLSALEDPTAFFPKRSSAGGATIRVRVSGKYNWCCEEYVAGPSLTSDVYQNWTNDKTQGMSACIGRAAALYRTIFRRNPEDECVRDAVIDAVLYVFRARYLEGMRRTGTVADLSNEVVKQAYSRFVDDFRKKLAATRNNLDDDISALADLLPARRNGAVDQVERRDLVDKINKMLSPEEQFITELRLRQYLSWKEIADRVGISVEVLRARWHRMCQNLQRWLRNQGYGPDMSF